MGFRRLQAEEFNPDIPDYARQMQGISDLSVEESRLTDARREQGAAERIRMDQEGMDAVLGGLRSGVEGGVDRYDKRKKEGREEARLDRSDARQDKADARQEEEFNAGASERQALSETGGKRVQLGIEGQEAGVAANKASARASTVSADVQEREEAIMNGVAKYPDAQDGETNRMYLARLDREGKTAQLRLAQSQLDEQIAGRPGRERLMTAQIGQANAGIASANASTRAQNMQTSTLEREERIKTLTAVAMAPTSDQLKSMAPNLAAEVNAGRITPEEAASVLSSIKNTESQRALQQQLVNNANPEYQRRISQTYEAQDKAKLFNDAIADMEQALKENKSNLFFDEMGAKERFAAQLEAMDMKAEAKSVLSSFGENDPTEPASTDARMLKYLNVARARARRQLGNYSADVLRDPKVAELSAKLNIAGISGEGNVKPDLFGGARAPQNAGNGIAPTGTQSFDPRPSQNGRKRMAPAQVGGKR